MLKFLGILRYTVLFVLLFTGIDASAQWMAGFRYRRIITINKPLINAENAAVPHYTDFCVLIQLEDIDLIHLEDAFDNKVTHPQGLDISFAGSILPITPLKFQLDNYDPVSGKLSCWVLIPRLIAKESSEQPTVIYLYYGSTTLHNPLSSTNESMWQKDFFSVRHFSEVKDGKIGMAKSFNGINDQLNLGSTGKPELNVSAWIKLNKLGINQMIFSNDSIAVGGLQLSINAENKLFLQIRRVGTILPIIGRTTLNIGQWYHVSLSVNSNSLTMLLNGQSEAPFPPNVLPTIFGQITIGASKNNDQYFNGLIDELRITLLSKLPAWMNIHYINQSDPKAFITVGQEAVNSSLEPSFYIFQGSQNNNRWSVATNWNPVGVPPTNNKNILIKAGATLELSTPIIINKLLMEAGSKINLTNNLQIIESIELQPTAAILSSIASTEMILRLDGNVINNGQIKLTEPAAKIIFSGNQITTKYIGSGTTTVAFLEFNRPAAAASVRLAAPMFIENSLKLISGHLDANGQLNMQYINGKTAVVHPVSNQASITGNVQVQIYVPGSFPSPATGRGWRLESSPVYQTGIAEASKYNLLSLQNTVFVTGKGGQQNGFDDSPNNGATIYTHDQALTGTLAQKYIPIANMQSQIPVGRGFFLYSRGNRNLPDAFKTQVQQPPFANAAPYVLTYTGQLFTGDLVVNVYNKDTGGEGDGFNLLGNPYAAPIKWKNLEKVNIGPYLWLYDPINGDYKPILEEDTLIMPGTGFFIRVNSGSTNGSVRFSENSKYIL
ncbi:LamG-like jellyroll fold domain-containing protein [Pedobacter sp.]|uniref:LamG-like jellyroll fold domain-containing protein n=1 Tax=Pedobacter sp. TaxID=1411316 RepID=UPI003D7FE739